MRAGDFGLGHKGRGCIFTSRSAKRRFLKLRVDSDCSDTHLRVAFSEMFSVVAIALIIVVLALVAVDTIPAGRLAKVSNS